MRHLMVIAATAALATGTFAGRAAAADVAPLPPDYGPPPVYDAPPQAYGPPPAYYAPPAYAPPVAVAPPVYVVPGCGWRGCYGGYYYGRPYAYARPYGPRYYYRRY